MRGSACYMGPAPRVPPSSISHTPLGRLLLRELGFVAIKGLFSLLNTDTMAGKPMVLAYITS